MWNTGLTSFVSCLLVLSTSFAWGQTGQKKIIHDAEYYILEAQNGERWAAEDRRIDATRDEILKKYGPSTAT
jgi:arylsulfatase